MRTTLTTALVAATLVSFSTVAVVQANVAMETVHVGNAGNAGEIQPQGIFGGVSYTYSIGKYAVTAGQYTEFLNAVAKTDWYGLYSMYMWQPWPGEEDHCCKIQRSGSLGNFTYSVADDMANRPVTNVSWGDCARFANWMYNGQPTGEPGPTTTENGSYNLNGATSNIQLNSVIRNPNATWVIPSVDEWYKAAYHKNDGATNNYFSYPTSSDSIDTSMANFGQAVGHITDVGTYPVPSPYGTFDQGGNVWEWNELLNEYGSSRERRGGSFLGFEDHLRSSYRITGSPELGNYRVGFRLAYIPEPATLPLLALGGLTVLRRR